MTHQRLCSCPGAAAEQGDPHAAEVSGRSTIELADSEPALRRIANRLCANTDDARDLVQDTFERALRSTLSEDVRSPGAWLATIMHNLFVNRCRTAARRPDHEPLEDKHDHVMRAGSDAPEPAWSRIALQDIHDALELIEPMYREVYKLHTFGHMSYEQIAHRLSLQRITVGTRLTRARKRLREVLAQSFGLEAQS